MEDNASSSRGRKRKVVTEEAWVEEERFLEQQMIAKYNNYKEGRGPFCRGEVFSMIVYRMYILGHRDNELYTGENTINLRNRKVSKPRRTEEDYQKIDVERCFGRVDFGFQRDKTYTLSASRKYRPIKSRRTNAHYTFYCDNSSGLVSSPHCEFSRPNHSNDFVWIKDLESEFGTYVNGKRISPMTKYQLVDGDIVGLGIPHNCTSTHGVDIKSRRFFIFKVKNLKLLTSGDSEEAGLASVEDETVQNENPVSMALNNSLIANKILGSLKIKDLKPCRMINSFWKSIADKILVRKCYIRFEFTHPGYYPRYLTISEVKWSDSFQEKVALMKKYTFNGFEIDISNNSSYVVPRQFISDMQWLFDNMGQQIKHLVLSISVAQDKNGSQFKKVFSKLTNLESLDLSLDINTNIYPVMGSLPLSIPSVRKLSLWIHDVEGDDELRDPLKNHIIAEVCKLFPNLEEITIKTGLLQNFLQHLHSNPTAWKNLTFISSEFELYADDEGENPAVCFSMITGLQCQTLKSLQLDDIPPLKAEGVIALEKMLKKHSSNLEFLSLKFADGGSVDAHVLNLPRFPRLKHLQLVIYVEDCDLNLKLNFPSGLISYEKDFPVLHTLSLLPDKEDEDEQSDDDDDESDNESTNIKQILDCFLPETPTVSRSMRYVEFNLEKEVMKQGNPEFEWYQKFVERFSSTFPNVHNPFVTNI